MNQERMELWSNGILTEFAIKFNSVNVVTTSNNPQAMGKVDNVLIDLAMNWIGTILFRSGLFIISQTNSLCYSTPKVLYKKSSIFETKKFTFVHTILSILLLG